MYSCYLLEIPPTRNFLFLNSHFLHLKHELNYKCSTITSLAPGNLIIVLGPYIVRLLYSLAHISKVAILGDSGLVA